MTRWATLILAALLLLPCPAAMAGAGEISAELAAGPSDRRILVMLELAPEHYRPSADYGAAGGYGDAAAAAARRRLAARIARTQGLVLGENWPMPLLGVDCVVMIVPEGRSIDEVVLALSHLSGVAWSQPMHQFDTQGDLGHNDRLFRAQPAARQWQLADLHKVATGLGVRVAIIDSQIDIGHPDLRGQIAASRDFVEDVRSVPENHGTGIAGIIAARADNRVGIAGVAPGARLIGLRACWQVSGASGRTVCDSLSLAKALTFAIEQKVAIINMSLTGPSDVLIGRLVEIGLRRGSAIVAAVDPRTSQGFPASLPGVIAVAEEGMASTRPGVYNAPGRDIPTTEPGGRWYLVSGNSYAAAHVSGLLALMREVDSARLTGNLLVAARNDGGAIDACFTLLRAARRPGRSCAQAN